MNLVFSGLFQTWPRSKHDVRWNLRCSKSDMRHNRVLLSSFFKDEPQFRQHADFIRALSFSKISHADVIAGGLTRHILLSWIRTSGLAALSHAWLDTASNHVRSITGFLPSQDVWPTAVHSPFTCKLVAMANTAKPPKATFATSLEQPVYLGGNSRRRSISRIPGQGRR